MYLTFDAGPNYADRYTVFPFRRCKDPDVRRMYLAVDDCGGRAFSQWGEANPADLFKNPEFRRVPFSSLPAETRRHVISRIKD